MNKQETEITHAIAEEEKKLEEHQAKLAEVVPQTGQIKFARKRVFDSQNKISRMRQEKNWLKLRIEDRRRQTRKNYLEAFNAGKPWPDPAEFEQYRAQTKLREAKREWDVQQRLQDARPPKSHGEGVKSEGEKKE